jgi:hypothetical protein
MLPLTQDLQHQGTSSEHFLECGLREQQLRLDHLPTFPTKAPEAFNP